MGKPASAKSDNLERYRSMRDFKKTAEPHGESSAADAFVFIIQKHEASHLHYDFRLQLDGTLKSWAVPKGPSYDPRDKRLAMQVEDHPVEYATFEGTIPQGEYGGGTVMLWDRGTWEPVGDPQEGLVAGKLVFRLHGERMQGEWTLVRTHGKAAADKRGKSDEPGRQWLLIKHRDEYVREGDAGTFVAENITSISTDRSMAEIAANKAVPVKTLRAAKAKSGLAAKAQSERIRKEVASTAREPKKTSKSTNAENSKAAQRAAKVAPLPDFIEPQLATLSDAVPKGAGWVHEVKFDGYRMLTYIENAKARMLSRNKKDWTDSFTTVAQAAALLPVTNAIIDGEVVSMDADHKSNFSGLKNALADGRSDTLQYFAFDLLYVDGVDIREKPLSERKALLAALIEKAPGAARGIMQFSAEFNDDPEAFFKSVCSMQLEGVVSKRADARYLSGRGKTWLKTKCSLRAEFVIGGFTPPANGSDGIGALLLGYFDGTTLHYAGRVGTGWNAKTSAALRTTLEKLINARCSFKAVETAARRNAQWVRPQLVCEIQFAEWTPDGHLRHPSFQGLREDKPAEDVTRERSVPLAKTAEAGVAEAASRKATPASRSSKGRAVNAAPKSKTAKAAHKLSSGPALTESSASKEPPNSGENIAASKRGSDATVGSIRISHPDRIIFPETQITKQQLAEYYLSISDMLLPHIIRRPISVLRCPNGAGETCFFQCHLGLGTSPHLRELSVPIKSDNAEYMMIDNVEGLLALIQWGVIEIHPWQCTAKKLDKPDRMIFDLDPAPDVPWKAVMEGAREVRARMEELHLESFVKTTGGKGLHIVVPMAPVYDWDTIKSFARLIAQSMEADSPHKYLSKMTKASRTGRIFVDYLRNDNTATAVAPFSVRARAGAPVALPVAWKDVTTKLDPLAFSVESAAKILRKSQSDPWSGFFDLKQRIEKKFLTALRIPV